LPGGVTVMIVTDPEGGNFVTTIDASGVQATRRATAAEIAEAAWDPPARSRAVAAAVAAAGVLTILAHGAVFVSLGAALGVWIKRAGGPLAASVGLILFVTVGWPLLDFLLGYPTYGGSLTRVSAFPAFLVLLLRRSPFKTISEVASWAGSWDAILVQASVILC